MLRSDVKYREGENCRLPPTEQKKSGTDRLDTLIFMDCSFLGDVELLST